MDGKPIKLTAQEVEGLEQVVSAGHKWIDGSNPAYPGLILKIGGAFLEAVGRGGGQELYLSEQEAWYLREIVPANMRVRGETVGQSLKRKLYPILLAEPRAGIGDRFLVQRFLAPQRVRQERRWSKDV